MGYCLQLIIYLFREHSATISLTQFLVDVHAADRSPLVLELHQQVWVVVYFFGIEMDVGGLVHLEILIDFLGHVLFV